LKRLINSLHPDFPYILHLTEHQLKPGQLELTYLENLGSGFCRQNLRKDGVSIFVHSDLKFSKVNTQEFCKEQYIEASAIKIKSSFPSICIIAIYRAP
jgi:hypothetical protein